jgi:hypothetical protein
MTPIRVRLTLDLMLGPVESAMGAKPPESGRESTSYVADFSRDAVLPERQPRRRVTAE